MLARCRVEVVAPWDEAEPAGLCDCGRETAIGNVEHWGLDYARVLEMGVPLAKEVVGRHFFFLFFFPLFFIFFIYFFSLRDDGG